MGINSVRALSPRATHTKLLYLITDVFMQLRALVECYCPKHRGTLTSCRQAQWCTLQHAIATGRARPYARTSCMPLATETTPTNSNAQEIIQTLWDFTKAYGYPIEQLPALPGTPPDLDEVLNAILPVGSDNPAPQTPFVGGFDNPLYRYNMIDVDEAVSDSGNDIFGPSQDDTPNHLSYAETASEPDDDQLFSDDEHSDAAGGESSSSDDEPASSSLPAQVHNVSSKV